MLLAVPEEVLDLCWKHVDEKKTLRALRLVNKQILPSATKRLFRTVRLLPTAESAGKAQSVLDSDGLRPLVTNIILHTSEEKLTRTYVEEEAELPEEYESVIHDLGRFRNLHSVQLKFSPDCASSDGSFGWAKEVRETFSFRNAVLKMLVEGLNDETRVAAQVRTLSIDNLQDMLDDVTVSSKDFKAVLSRLESLALNIATEYDDASPENSITMPELHNFFNAQLKVAWLSPVQAQLSSLTLYSDTYWGYFPACDLRGLHFPRLRNLELGNYTFTHDWQMDWIVSHADTLQSLSLDDCPIVHQCSMNFGFNPDRAPPSLEVYEGTGLVGGGGTWQYQARWHNHFRRIQVELPKLKRFACGHGNWRGSAFGARHQLSTHLDVRRYVVYSWGTGPSQWLEAREYLEDDGKAVRRYDACLASDDEEAPVYPDCDKEDQMALNELLATLRDRRS